jgi:hypothetical protein
VVSLLDVNVATAMAHIIADKLALRNCQRRRSCSRRSEAMGSDRSSEGERAVVCCRWGCDGSIAPPRWLSCGLGPRATDIQGLEHVRAVLSAVRGLRELWEPLPPELNTRAERCPVPVYKR